MNALREPLAAAAVRLLRAPPRPLVRHQVNVLRLVLEYAPVGASRIEHEAREEHGHDRRTVSRALAALLERGLVARERVGRESLYEVTDEGGKLTANMWPEERPDHRSGHMSDHMSDHVSGPPSRAVSSGSSSLRRSVVSSAKQESSSSVFVGEETARELAELRARVAALEAQVHAFMRPVHVAPPVAATCQPSLPATRQPSLPAPPAPPLPVRAALLEKVVKGPPIAPPSAEVFSLAIEQRSLEYDRTEKAKSKPGVVSEEAFSRNLETHWRAELAAGWTETRKLIDTLRLRTIARRARAAEAEREKERRLLENAKKSEATERDFEGERRRRGQLQALYEKLPLEKRAEIDARAEELALGFVKTGDSSLEVSIRALRVLSQRNELLAELA